MASPAQINEVHIGALFYINATYLNKRTVFTKTCAASCKLLQSILD